MNTHQKNSLKIKDMESKKLLTTAVGVAVSLGLLFATIWVASKAWKTGQKNAEG